MYSICPCLYLCPGILQRHFIRTAGTLPELLYLGKAYLVFVVAIQLVYAISGYQAFSQINLFSQSGAPLVSVRNDRMVPYDPGSTRTMSGACSGTVTGAGAWSRILSGNRGFLCLSRIMVFGPFFYLGYYMERETMQRLLQNRYRRAVVPMAGLLAVGILVFGQRLEDPLSMVYENFSYYELENVSSGLLVRLILLLAACILSWALLFFVPQRKTRISAVGQNTMPVYMLHRIFRDILMFSGIYEHVEDGGLSVLLLFGLLSIGMISVFSRPTVVRMWNRLLALYTPQWLCRIRSANV